jgi:hypothetical protein
VEIAGPFKIEDQPGAYVIKPGQGGPVLTGEVIREVTASASSSDPEHPVSRIVDGSGLQDWNRDGLEEHGTNTKDMWLSAKRQVRGWVEFDFGGPRKLDGIDVWNYNEQDGRRRGIQRADISIWIKERGWNKIRKNFEFERATAGGEYDDPTFVDMGGVTTAKVRLDNIKNFDDVNHVGLSEVRFYEVAGERAVRPVPANGVRCSDKKVTLAWIPAARAKTHKVYLGTDAGNLQLMGEKAGSGYMRAELSGLARNTRYFWRVNEVDAEGNETMGKMWSFASAGLVGWWKFDETEGTTAADSSGNGNNGTLQGSPVWRPQGGKIGGTLEFNGKGDYVKINNESAFDITDQITISAWVNIASVPQEWTGIVTKGDSAWRISTDFANNVFHFGLGQNDYLNGKTTVGSGQWHHVLCVYDGRKMSTYVDGKLDATRPREDNIGTNDFPVCIGGNAEMPGRCWHGLIDDIRVYNYALSRKDTEAIYQGGQPEPPAETKVAIKFLEPLGSAARENAVVAEKAKHSPAFIQVAIVAAVVVVVIITSRTAKKKAS